MALSNSNDAVAALPEDTMTKPVSTVQPPRQEGQVEGRKSLAADNVGEELENNDIESGVDPQHTLMARARASAVAERRVHGEEDDSQVPSTNVNENEEEPALAAREPMTSSREDVELSRLDKKDEDMEQVEQGVESSDKDSFTAGRGEEVEKGESHDNSKTDRAKGDNKEEAATNWIGKENALEEREQPGGYDGGESKQKSRESTRSGTSFELRNPGYAEGDGEDAQGLDAKWKGMNQGVEKEGDRTGSVEKGDDGEDMQDGGGTETHISNSDAGEEAEAEGEAIKRMEYTDQDAAKDGDADRKKPDRSGVGMEELDVRRADADEKSNNTTGKATETKGEESTTVNEGEQGEREDTGENDGKFERDGHGTDCGNSGGVDAHGRASEAVEGTVEAEGAGSGDDNMECVDAPAMGRSRDGDGYMGGKGNLRKLGPSSAQRTHSGMEGDDGDFHVAETMRGEMDQVLGEEGDGIERNAERDGDGGSDQDGGGTKADKNEGDDMGTELEAEREACKHSTDTDQSTANIGDSNVKKRSPGGGGMDNQDDCGADVDKEPTGETGEAEGEGCILAADK